MSLNSCVKHAGHTIKATDASLGSLEKLPIELRQVIYELVFDVKKPITLHNGLVVNREKRHLQPLDSAQKSWSAILMVSKLVHVEAAWVFYTKTILHLSIDHTLGCYESSRRGNASIRAMWGAVSQFRVLHLRLPSVQHLAALSDSTKLLVYAIDQLVYKWIYNPFQNTLSSQRDVTIHLSRVFEIKLSDHVTSDSLVDAQLTSHTAGLCWKNVDKVVERTVTNSELANWTVSAMAELGDGAKRKRGRRRYRRVKKLVRENGMGFVKLTAEEVPVSTAVDTAGVLGGPHRRFLN
ncbi:hypothetical protein EJ02DRAFT_458838 [Clathrospora elynae]|uniref:Uncharacterized protein n=1 Tax=Clathrospora elynae TaxID=706981 RepID=A0A6A5SBJ0_9PLEO|nr:hypothetical protein EJ02DRAFT_458838 [Clathrospora elynae]